MQKKYLAVFFIVSFISISCSSESSAKIKSINAMVSAINDSIQNGEFPSLEVNENSTTEGSPATLTMYFKGDRIVCITASVGHETWVNEFSYYFYANAKPMKYLKTTKDRPDNPAKEAIIYNDNGTVLWKNTDATIVPAQEIYNLFAKMQKIRLALSGY